MTNENGNAGVASDGGGVQGSKAKRSNRNNTAAPRGRGGGTIGTPKGRGRKKNKPDDVADSIRAASAMSGLEVRIIKKLKHQGHPAFEGGRIRISVLREGLQDWLDRIAAEDAQDPRERIDRLRADKLELEIAKLEGSQISLEDAVEFFGRVSATISTILTNKLTVEWPAHVAGRPAGEIRAIAEKTVTDICERIATELSSWTSEQ